MLLMIPFTGLNMCLYGSPCHLQAEQLRKSAYVPEDEKIYDPDTQRSCTIYAGTMVQQV